MQCILLVSRLDETVYGLCDESVIKRRGQNISLVLKILSKLNLSLFWHFNYMSTKK